MQAKEVDEVLLVTDFQDHRLAVGRYKTLKDCAALIAIFHEFFRQDSLDGDMTSVDLDRASDVSPEHTTAGEVAGLPFGFFEGELREGDFHVSS